MYGIAMSTEAVPEAGKISCQLFVVGGASRIDGTGATGRHTIGIAKFVPPLNAVQF